MILAVDIGNTKTCLALYAEDGGDKLKSLQYFFYDTRKKISSGALKDYIFWRLGSKDVDFSEISAVSVTSVVPNLSVIWEKFVEGTSAEFFLCDYKHAGKLIGLNYPDPSEVGCDFYCAAIAADRIYDGAKVVVDFGTASNYIFVNSIHEFIGGIICPGIDLGRHALLDKASMLEHFEPKLPKRTIGRSSEGAMLSGIVLGEVKRADGLIDAAIEEWDEKSPTVIFTGGYCEYLVKYSKYKPFNDKELVLKGAYLCYMENQS
ncbi:MAG: type III pantothenate kinase [Eggerthellaceae bacterium]|nr:type III pantothenate kinase [Eggerthellaceae bacterium]